MCAFIKFFSTDEESISKRFFRFAFLFSFGDELTYTGLLNA